LAAVSQLGPRIESSCIYVNHDRCIFPYRPKICLAQLGIRFQKLRFRRQPFSAKARKLESGALYAGPILRLWLFILLDKALMETKVAENERVGTSNGTPPLLHPTLSSRDASLSINARNAGYVERKLGRLILREACQISYFDSTQ
jgi:hypothetical protein